MLEDFLAEFEGDGIQCDAVPLHAPPEAGASAAGPDGGYEGLCMPTSSS